MLKAIAIIGGKEGESYDIFKRRCFGYADDINKTHRPESIKITLTVETPPFLTVIPFKKKKVAVLSICFKILPEGIEKGIEGLIGYYKVEEALPVAYTQTWRDGMETPGICLLTLFRKRPEIDYETFIDRWHNGHTPMSLRLHPLWNYNRNVVKDLLKQDSYSYDGIVEEQFRIKADLLNPIRFFGNPITMFYHMYEVYKDTKGFIEYKTMEPYYAAEYVIRGGVTD